MLLVSWEILSLESASTFTHDSRAAYHEHAGVLVSPPPVPTGTQNESRVDGHKDQRGVHRMQTLRGDR